MPKHGLSLSKKSKDFSDREHPHCAHGFSATPTNRTLVRIEVFFAPGNPWQKTDLKSPLRGQNTLFRQAGPMPKHGFSFICGAPQPHPCLANPLSPSQPPKGLLLGEAHNKREMPYARRRRTYSRCKHPCLAAAKNRQRREKGEGKGSARGKP